MAGKTARRRSALGNAGQLPSLCCRNQECDEPAIRGQCGREGRFSVCGFVAQSVWSHRISVTTVRHLKGTPLLHFPPHTPFFSLSPSSSQRSTANRCINSITVFTPYSPLPLFERFINPPTSRTFSPSANSSQQLLHLHPLTLTHTHVLTMGATQSQIRTTNGGSYGRRNGRRSFSKDSIHQHHGLQRSSASTHHLQPPGSSASPSILSHPQLIKKNRKNSAAGSCSPPSSYISLSSSSLQRAFGRRRSSNQTVDSVPSSSGSVTLCSNQSSARFSGDTSCAAGGSPSEEEFRWLHGRRYHNTSSLYMLPNDAEEVDR